jgi:hypothetical protein
MEGITIDEMSRLLKLPPKTVAIRLHRAGIKPISRQAIYPSDTPNKIKDVSMGRPKKLETKTKESKNEPEKKQKKQKKK